MSDHPVNQPRLNDVGGTIRRAHTGYLSNGREPAGLSERAIGFAIGACAVLMLGLGIAAVALTAVG